MFAYAFGTMVRGPFGMAWSTMTRVIRITVVQAACQALSVARSPGSTPTGWPGNSWISAKSRQRWTAPPSGMGLENSLSN